MNSANLPAKVPYCKQVLGLASPGVGKKLTVAGQRPTFTDFPCLRIALLLLIYYISFFIVKY